jgi:hypothetical protein
MYQIAQIGFNNVLKYLNSISHILTSAAQILYFSSIFFSSFMLFKKNTFTFLTSSLSFNFISSPEMNVGLHKRKLIFLWMAEWEKLKTNFYQ